jgi:hypothetical protein
MVRTGPNVGSDDSSTRRRPGDKHCPSMLGGRRTRDETRLEIGLRVDTTQPRPPERPFMSVDIPFALEPKQCHFLVPRPGQLAPTHGEAGPLVRVISGPV